MVHVCVGLGRVNSKNRGCIFLNFDEKSPLGFSAKPADGTVGRAFCDFPIIFLRLSASVREQQNEEQSKIWTILNKLDSPKTKHIDQAI